MLRSLKDFERYVVSATDGDLGSVADFLLDDERWVVRYLVVETGEFLGGRRVLISPMFFRDADRSSRHFQLALTVAQVKNSPNIDVDRPVSRQHERDYYHYYGYPAYWGYAGLWGAEAYPDILADSRWDKTSAPRSDHAAGDAHLRSGAEVRGYHIEGTDGAIGHVDDFVVNDESWEIRYLVADTSNWWFGNKVLVAPHWANRISWGERKVYVDVSRQAIKDSPAWNPAATIDRTYEEHLYDHHGRPPYWATGNGLVGARLAPHAEQEAK